MSLTRVGSMTTIPVYQEEGAAQMENQLSNERLGVVLDFGSVRNRVLTTKTREEEQSG